MSRLNAKFDRFWQRGQKWYNFWLSSATVQSAPTVTTQAVTNITTTTATANATIVNIGSENPFERGVCFMVGQTGDPTTANDISSDSGSFGASSFTKSLAGQDAGAYLRVRGYAINSAGTGYGTTVQMQFETALTVDLNAPSEGATVSATPTLNFTGFDPQSDALEYQLQICNDIDFDNSAVETLVDSYSEIYGDSTGGAFIGAEQDNAQSFHGINGNLSKAKFYLKKTGSPTGNLTAVLYAHSGTFGSTGTPIDHPLATSDIFDISTLTTSWAWIEFAFSDTNQYAMSLGTDYFISCHYRGGDASNRLDLRYDSSGTASGNLAYGAPSAFSPYGTADICFSVSANVSTPQLNVYSTQLNLLHIYSESHATDRFSTAGTYPKSGQSFRGVNGNLSLIKLWTKKTGSPTGTAVVCLYAHSGTFGVSSIPTGTALATSQTIDVSLLTTSWASVDFVFTGANQYAMNLGTDYCFAIEYSGGNISTDCVDVQGDGSVGKSDEGNGFYYNDGSYTISTGDMIFSAYTSLNFTAGHPFASSAAIDYIASTLASDTYYWRVRAIDPLGSNTWGSWSTIRSFVIGGSVWVTKSLKWFNGSTWSAKPLKQYTGGTWITKTIKKHT